MTARVVAARIRLPDGYAADAILGYHGRDRASPTEQVADKRLRKAVAVEGRPYVLTIALGRSAVITVDPEPDGTARAELVAIARRLLGLMPGAEGLAALAARKRRVARLVGRRPGLRIPLTATPFEALVWAILGQQINLAFAATLRRRVITACGLHHACGMIAHPDAAAVAALGAQDLIAMQVSTAKTRYLLDAATRVAGGGLALDGLAALPQAEAEARLLGLRGIGPWTANYVLLRGLGVPDCVPIGDSGLATALQKFYDLDARPSAAEQTSLMAVFAPYRSLATCHLWASLDETT